MATNSRRDEIAADWKERGYSCELWVDPPGQTWENFVHEEDELVIILEGELEVEVSGVVSRPAIGEEVFIAAGAYHSVRNVGGTTAKWVFGYRPLS